MKAKSRKSRILLQRTGSKPAGDSPGKLSKEIQTKIGSQLRAMYDEIVQQGVPERFAELLRRLERGGGRGIQNMSADEAVREAMLGAIPKLRAFAISLSGNVDRADDLVQETLVRALANIHSFQPGTNLQAWLFTILRNLFRSEYRKRRREVEDVEGFHANNMISQPEQESRLEFKELRAALAKLPPDQREALLLVGASGFSYEEAAAICGCAVGTIKSRVNRARNRLAAELSIESAEDIGPDPKIRAVVAGNSS